MTRITNFGIKRTYVQAGVSDDDEAEKGKEKTPSVAGDSSGPPKKRRKRDRKKKPKMATEEKGNHEGDSEKGQGDSQDLAVASSEKKKDNRSHTPKQKKDSKKDREARWKTSSESRRLKRIQDKRADTTCFVCREKGHAAKECRTAGKNEMEAGSVVGICYRCGTRRHNLSRCRKPVDPLNPLPFASCFVCHKKGHLASTCPENTEKGVYPDGGSCKLCGETSHLAKDCGLRKQDPTKTVLVLGTGKDAGADEDDFHILNRNKRDVDWEERQSTKKRKEMDVKVGAHSGLVKAFPVETRPAKGTKAVRKVVNF
ncbi:zinc knuckle family protein [Amanita muscaria]